MYERQAAPGHQPLMSLSRFGRRASRARGAQGSMLSGIGFSLKPPKWARNLIAGALKGQVVNIPGTGPVDLGSPDAAKRLEEAARRAAAEKLRDAAARAGEKISPSQPQSPMDAVPGGWMTLAALGIGAALILPRLLRGR